MLRHLLLHSATILDEVDDSTDQYGNDERTWEDTTGKVWPCRLDQTSDMETEVDRDTRQTWFKLMLVPEAKGHINSKSRVVIDGVTYEVFGTPDDMPRRHRTNHMEVVLRTIEG